MHRPGPTFHRDAHRRGGPVDIQVEGDTATIRYMMKGGLKVEQQLQLQRDGRTLSNRVTAKKLGMKFAHVEGTVRKLD